MTLQTGTNLQYIIQKDIDNTTNAALKQIDYLIRELEDAKSRLERKDQKFAVYKFSCDYLNINLAKRDTLIQILGHTKLDEDSTD